MNDENRNIFSHLTVYRSILFLRFYFKSVYIFFMLHFFQYTILVAYKNKQL